LGNPKKMYESGEITKGKIKKQTIHGQNKHMRRAKTSKQMMFGTS